MRKILSTMIISALVLAINATTVCAASGTNSTENSTIEVVAVTVTKEMTTDVEDKESVPALPQIGDIQPRDIFDLSEKNATIDWGVKAESYTQSRDNFKTNSTVIEVSLKSDVSASVTVCLLDSSGTEVAAKTDTLSTTLNTKFKFSNLTSAKTYKVKIKNNGQRDINVSGKITQ